MKPSTAFYSSAIFISLSDIFRISRQNQSRQNEQALEGESLPTYRTLNDKEKYKSFLTRRKPGNTGWLFQSNLRLARISIAVSRLLSAVFR